MYLKYLKGELFSQKTLYVDYSNVTIDLEKYLLGIQVAQDFDSGEINPDRTYWYDHTKGDEPGPWKPRHYVNQFNHLYGTIFKCLTVDIPFTLNEHVSWMSVVMKKSVFPNGVRPTTYSENEFFSVRHVLLYFYHF